MQITIRVAPDMISSPGYGRRIWGRIDHLSMHLSHCVIGQEFIVLQIHSFINLTVYVKYWWSPWRYCLLIAGYIVTLC